MHTLLALAAVLAIALPAAAAPLTESARLTVVYEAILSARFDEARGRLAAACPPAPREACLALQAALTWWEIQLDPDSRARDDEIQEQSARAVEAAAAWTRREPGNAEAWFYLAGAHAPLTQWRIMRSQRLSAARDARRIKEALERAVALDPSLHDAYFGIGLYHYYADVAPAALKFLRVLLLMPGGDRAQGLREMLQARNRGVLLSGEADFQMHYLYLWYEHDTGRAVELLHGLDARYPSNPLFLQRLADVERLYRHDTAAAVRAWETLFTRAMNHGLAGGAGSDALARLGLAEALIENGGAARAIEIVTPLLGDVADVPYGAGARAALTAGRAFAALGDRSRAMHALDQAIARAPRDDPQSIRSRARTLRSQLRSSVR